MRVRERYAKKRAVSVKLKIIGPGWQKWRMYSTNEKQQKTKEKKKQKIKIKTKTINNRLKH